MQAEGAAAEGDHDKLGTGTDKDLNAKVSRYAPLQTLDVGFLKSLDISIRKHSFTTTP